MSSLNGWHHLLEIGDMALFLMSCAIVTLLVEAVVCKVKSEDVNIEEICLSCGGKSQEQHPLFEGGVCDDCKVSFPLVMTIEAT